LPPKFEAPTCEVKELVSKQNKLAPVCSAAAMIFFVCFSYGNDPRPASAATPQDNSTGSIRVKSDATAVQVFLDDKEAGATPVILKDIPAGVHRLMLIKEGYEDHIEQVQVVAQKAASVFAVMKRLTAKLPDLPVDFKVMHQHRLGYCVGVITVSSEALDYKSEKADDVFHLPIKELKSVSRSWGPVPGVGPSGINGPTDAMAFRVEAPGRAYGFLAFKDSTADPVSVASVKTKELFQVVYALWSTTLKPKENK